jgi:hypothetical protein
LVFVPHYYPSEAVSLGKPWGMWRLAPDFFRVPLPSRFKEIFTGTNSRSVLKDKRTKKKDLMYLRSRRTRENLKKEKEFQEVNQQRTPPLDIFFAFVRTPDWSRTHAT